MPYGLISKPGPLGQDVLLLCRFNGSWDHVRVPFIHGQHIADYGQQHQYQADPYEPAGSLFFLASLFFHEWELSFSGRKFEPVFSVFFQIKCGAERTATT